LDIKCTIASENESTFFYMLCQERTLCKNVWKKLNLNIVNGRSWTFASNRTTGIAIIIQY
jgi:hypothetical protein